MNGKDHRPRARQTQQGLTFRAVIRPLPRPGADAARLVALRPAERAVLMPHLDDGPVMLTEFSNAQTALPAVTMMARVHASADAVADVIAHPERYEAFMPALDEVEVRANAPRLHPGRDFAVLHRDEHLVVVYKPSGLLSVAALASRHQTAELELVLATLANQRTSAVYDDL